MSVLKRIQNIISANINDLLDKVEDPETAVRQMIREMEQGISEMRKNTASVLASKKMTEKRLNRTIEIEKEWQANAETAVLKGEDEPAKQALQKKRIAAEKIALLRKQLDDEQSLVDKLKSELANLEDKIQEARTKQSTLIAKKRAAVTKKKIMKSAEKCYSTAGSIINGFDMFDRFREKIEEQTSEFEAKDELRKTLEQGNVDETFSRLRKEKDINDELAVLKKKLGG